MELNTLLYKSQRDCTCSSNISRVSHQKDGTERQDQHRNEDEDDGDRDIGGFLLIF